MALQMLRRLSMTLLESDAVVYRISVVLKPARETNGVQSSTDLGGGGVGSVPGGRNVPS